MEKRIEPLLPKGSNAGGMGGKMKWELDGTFRLRGRHHGDRALWKTYIFALSGCPVKIWVN